MKIAATADLHARTEDIERLRALAEGATLEADVLVMGGDLTDLGQSKQAQVLLEALGSCSIPVIATLGNHDHESGDAAALSHLFIESGIHLLDRTSVSINGVGFSGVKGFCGGFEGNLANSFGEDLRGLGTERRVAVLHYSPIRATVEGESPEIYPFLGTSHLARALDEGGATVALHGHAHNGSFKGETPGGVPVFNVSVPVLQYEGFKKPYYVFEV
jgi:Icc-related predicted phosphoesterase